MKEIIIISKLLIKLIFLLALAAAVYVLAASSSIISKRSQTAPIEQSSGAVGVNQENFMKIFSPSFEDGAAIPAQYTCDGDDSSPALKISDVPPEAKSLALLMDDPDSPSGNFAHWVMWNIRPDEKEIKENGKPENIVEGINSFGNTGYRGPCPRSGEHRYFFRLYALDMMLDLSSGAGALELKQAMQGHVLTEAEAMGRYIRR
ncbi:MAG: YbhB/YbcL family Raf kinase inhibitor-like protein [Patescibacteria group bacterium]